MRPRIRLGYRNKTLVGENTKNDFSKRRKSVWRKKPVGGQLKAQARKDLLLAGMNAQEAEMAHVRKGLFWELNPGPLAP